MSKDLCTPLIIKKGAKTCVPLLLTYWDAEKTITPIGCFNYTDQNGWIITPIYCNSRTTCVSPFGVCHKPAGSNTEYGCLFPLYCCSDNPRESRLCTPLTYVNLVRTRRDWNCKVISPLGCWDHLPKDVPLLQDGPPRQYMGDICSICHSTSVDYGLSPCGHNCLCSTCAKSNDIQKLEVCPACRSKIEGVYQIK